MKINFWKVVNKELRTCYMFRWYLLYFQLCIFLSWQILHNFWSMFSTHTLFFNNFGATFKISLLQNKVNFCDISLNLVDVWGCKLPLYFFGNSCNIYYFRHLATVWECDWCCCIYVQLNYIYSLDVAVGIRTNNARNPCTIWKMSPTRNFTTRAWKTDIYDKSFIYKRYTN